MLRRLTRSADFERALGGPACARSPHFAVHYLAAPSTGPAAGTDAPKLSTDSEQRCAQLVDELPSKAFDRALQLGVVVPKRHARRSVTRTLLKRQMRAAAERRSTDPGCRLAAGIWVLRLRAPFERSQFESAASQPLRRAARVELDRLLDAAQRRTDEIGRRCAR